MDHIINIIRELHSKKTAHDAQFTISFKTELEPEKSVPAYHIHNGGVLDHDDLELISEFDAYFNTSLFECNLYECSEPGFCSCTFKFIAPIDLDRVLREVYHMIIANKENNAAEYAVIRKFNAKKITTYPANIITHTLIENELRAIKAHSIKSDSTRMKQSGLEVTVAPHDEPIQCYHDPNDKPVVIEDYSISRHYIAHRDFVVFNVAHIAER